MSLHRNTISQRKRYRLGVAHFSMLQALQVLIFSYLLFCVLILIPPLGSLSWAPPQRGPSALSGGGGASDVLPFPAESATINGGTVCCQLLLLCCGRGAPWFYLLMSILLSGTRAILWCDFDGNCVFVTILWVFVCNAYIGYRRRIILKH